MFSLGRVTPRMTETFKSDFFEEQHQILSRLRDATKVKEQGIVRSPLLQQEGRGSYLIALRHPEEITRPLEELSRKIAEVAPALEYSRKTLHTTIALWKAGPNFEVRQDELERLQTAIEPMEGRLISPVLTYSEIFYNQDSVMTVGEAREDFREMANQVLEGLSEVGIEARPPWGGHITVSRFTEPVGANDLRPLFQLLDTAQMDLRSIPVSLDVGHTEMTDGGFSYGMTYSIPLQIS